MLRGSTVRKSLRSSPIFTLMLLFIAFTADARQYASIIVDETNGSILHAENPDMRTYPASLAKIMTLYLIFEQLSNGQLGPNQRLEVSARAANRPPSRLGLKRGQKIRVKDAINALITKSANDVATVVAEAISGTEKQFAILMTKRARELGMSATTFRNASGLPHRRQVTTARDMARLSISIWRNFPKYFSLFSQKTFKFGKRKFRNHNNLLRRYKGTNGIKTGFINSSGYNLAVSMQRDGRRLVGVIFGGKTTARRDNKMIRLLGRTMKMMARHDQMVKRNALALSNAQYRAHQKVRFPTLLSEQSKSSEKSWGIQIGAYKTFSQASRVGSKAVQVLTSLAKTPLIVEKIFRANKTLYRTRFLGMSKDRALNICQILIRERTSCELVKSK
mgnify:CR=1 FL=1